MSSRFGWSQRRSNKMSAEVTQARYEEIATLKVLGAKNTELAKQFGYAPGTITSILKRPEVQARMAEVREELDTAIESARNKVLDAAAAMIDMELEIALSTRTVHEDGEEREVYAYKTAERQKAAQYLLDKIIPTIQKSEHAHHHTSSPVEIDLLHKIDARLQAKATAPPALDFENSPHIHAGEDAIPRAIEIPSSTAAEDNNG